MKRNRTYINKAVSFTVLIVLIGLVGALFYMTTIENSLQRSSTPQITEKPEVNDFASCIAAGNPVMESHPEQCVADGQTYTNPDQDVSLTEGWNELTSEEGRFSIKHPTNWAQPLQPELCNPGLIMLGADAESVGQCGSENGGQMVFQAFEADSSDVSLRAKGYTDITEQTVTVDGVEGVRYSGNSPGPHPETGFGYAEGQKVVQYVFRLGETRIFTAEYTALEGMPDVLDDFDLVVKETLQFED